VLLARSSGGQTVAVRVIRPDLAADPEFLARFRREVAAARNVDCRYAALVVDADVDGPVPWLATAYISGPSLADRVRVEGPLPAATAVKLAAGLAAGVAAVHAAGLVHRDLKPSNVLLEYDGPRVIDFGMSQAMEGSSPGLITGSPGFISPEQAEGHDVGQPSDVFSLGAVVTFACTGHGPFGIGSAAELGDRVVHALPDLAGVPAEIRPIVERCLAKDPGERPAVAELLDAFGDPDVQADWLSPPHPGDKRSRDRRLAFLAIIPAAALAAALLVPDLAGNSPSSSCAANSPEPAASGTLPARRDAINPPAHPVGSVKTLSPVASFKDPSGYELNGILLSSDGKELAAWDSNNAFTAGNVFLWNTTTHANPRRFDDPGGSAPYAVAFAHAGETMAISDSANPKIYVWNVAGQSISCAFSPPGEGSPFSAEVFSPGGGSLAAGDTGFASVYLWKPGMQQQYALLRNPEGINAFDVGALDFSPDGKTLAEIGLNGTAYLWGMATHQITATITGSSGPEGIISLAFSPDGRTIAIVDGDVIRTWDVATGSFTGTITYPGNDPVEVAYDPNGKTIAIGDAAGNIYLQDIASHKDIAILPHYSPFQANRQVFEMYGKVQSFSYSSFGGNGLLFDSTGKTLATYTSANATAYLYNIGSLSG
jgi:serine/threonine protein kinase